MWICVSCAVSQLKSIESLLDAGPRTYLGDRSERPAPCTEDVHSLIPKNCASCSSPEDSRQWATPGWTPCQCGILTGTLKSRGILVYFVIPLLLFLWQSPSFSILGSPNRRAIGWLHSQKIDRKPVGDLWITRRGDRSACHPDLGAVGHSVSGFLRALPVLVRGLWLQIQPATGADERHWQGKWKWLWGQESAYQAQVHGRWWVPLVSLPSLPATPAVVMWVSSPHLATILGTLSSDPELELLSLSRLPSLAPFLSHQCANRLPVLTTCSHRSLWYYLHLSLDR